MRGKDFIDRLEAAFPGVLKHHYAGLTYTAEADASVCVRLDSLAAAVGAHLTPEVLAKARARHGLVAFRQHRRQNGTAPPVDPRTQHPAEEQLPLEANAVIIGNGTGASQDIAQLVAAAVKAELAGVVERLEGVLAAGRGRA